MTKINNLQHINSTMDKGNNNHIETPKNQDNTSLFDEYDKHARRSRLKASLDKGIIDEKEYLKEVKGLTIEERSISDFIKEKNEESIALKKYMLENEEILPTMNFVTKLFESKTNKFDGSPVSDNLTGVAGILAKYNVSAQDIITRLLNRVIVELEDGEKKLKEKGYSEESISIIKKLSEDKEATNNIKIISAADNLYNTRSLIDNYLIEQDDIRKKFNIGKDEQIKILENYLETLKNSFSHPIVAELEEVIKRFLRIIK